VRLRDNPDVPLPPPTKDITVLKTLKFKPARPKPAGAPC
jgi:hypothetical protein